MKKNLILAGFFSVLIYVGCQSEQEVPEQPKGETGQELAQTYCGSCHQNPDPTLLDRESWEKYMLPRMGYMLGIYENEKVRDSLIEAGPGGKIVEAAKIYPKEPMLDQEKWEKIRNYYLENAPEELADVSNKTITEGLSHFKVVKPGMKLSPPSTTLIKFNDNQEIYVGDAHTKSLIHLDANLGLIKAGQVNEGAVHLEEINDELWITVMGSFSPTDAPEGFILNLPKSGGKQALIAVDQLRRPVHSSYGDLNGDGLMDIVVSEFGKWTGRLSLFVNQGDKTFKQQTLINQTGAIRTYLRDFDGDGKQDIIALFGQGNEGIWILYNQGDGKFRTEQVVELSPSHGSSYFNLFDYNGDGHEDIIYTAGDNADFKPLMKPYHGIYIFENDGRNHFKEVFFFQLNGAYAAIPRDFDQDGDFDIAAISFFPDYQNTPQESFVYLENDGQMNFTASTFADNTMGRWIVMDVGDPDQDGDQDLILGSLAFEVIPKSNLIGRWVQEGLPFVILENTTK